MNLKNKNVLITGGARRLGRAMSLAVARAGGNVIIHHGHSSQEALQLKEQIESLSREAHIIQADFSTREETQQVIPAALNFGPLFALINSASIFQDLDWKETTDEGWDAHLEINLTAPFLLSQAFASSLPDGAQGRIINILDWRALRPGGDHFPYTITKAGLAAMTKSLASALAPHILVNALALGAILPPSDGSGDDPDELIQHVPANRWAQVKEVQQALLFFLTGPTYITGEILHVDGGRHLI